MPDVPCAHATIGQPPAGGFPLGRKSAPVLNARPPKGLLVTYFRANALPVVPGSHRRLGSLPDDTIVPGWNAAAPAGGGGGAAATAAGHAHARISATQATRTLFIRRR